MKKVIFFIVVYFAFRIYSQIDYPPTVPNCITQNGKENDELIKKGLLNVNLMDNCDGKGRIDSTGIIDSTEGIQNAINEAYDNELVLYFPCKTVYKVSEMLRFIQRVYCGSTCLPGRTKAQYIVGCDDMNVDDRPKIVLNDNSNGFGDDNNPKALIRIWTQDTNDPTEQPTDDGQGNNFNQVFKGINLDLGNNKGAIGIYFQGAQGCSVEDVRIQATNAYAGMYQLTGPGGGTYNVEIHGGKYGVLGGGTSPVLVGCKFINQEINAIQAASYTPVTLVGFYIEKKTSGPVISIPDNYLFNSAAGTYSLIDGEIVVENIDTIIFNHRGRSQYMKNVYIKSNVATNLIENKNSETVSLESGCHLIEEYSYCDKTTSSTDSSTQEHYESRVLIDGVLGQSETKTISVSSKCDSINNDLINKHIVFSPSFADKDAVDAVNDLGIDNSGSVDVSTKLQEAIDNNKKVFLPKGKYLLSKTLELHKDTILFGIAKQFSILTVDIDAWKPTSEVCIVQTDDDKDGTTFLGYVRVNLPLQLDLQYSYFSGICWRAGRNSVLKNPFVYWLDYVHQLYEGTERKVFKYTGGGGGRFYFPFYEIAMRSEHENNRIFYFDSTDEPLSIYGFNPEHSRSTFTEIVDSKNIRIFGMKSESNEIVINVKTSENIFVTGHGVGDADSSKPIFLIEESNNVVFSNMNPQFFISSATLQEIYQSNTYTIDKDFQVALFKRGDVDWTVYDHISYNPDTKYNKMIPEYVVPLTIGLVVSIFGLIILIMITYVVCFLVKKSRKDGELKPIKSEMEVMEGVAKSGVEEELVKSDSHL